jgi:mTERF domain-containing protein
VQILSLSIENCLQPKYNYLINQLKGDVQTVTSFPAYFSLSLEQRIIPRHRFLEHLKRTPEGPFPMRVLTISDYAFCKWAKSTEEAYEKFRHDLLLSTFARKFEWKNKVHI